MKPLTTGTILVVFCLSTCFINGGPQPPHSACGTLKLSQCNHSGAPSNISCSVSKHVEITGLWNKKPRKKGYAGVYVTDLSIRNKCQLNLCEDQDLMGYCATVPGGTTAAEKEFKYILDSDSLSMRCSCAANVITVNDGMHFDSNYVGVVYSPYDKYWEPTGPNGSLTRVAWKDYTEEEISHSLQQIAKKFSYITTYGVGTASNTSEWYEGDKIAFVPKLAAELNEKLGYLAIRVSVGIFRKDDVSVIWKSKELYNAIDVSKVANNIFNGTVWGIVVTSNYVTDVEKANDAIEMITEVKEISARENLHLRVGIRIKTCLEYIASKRPEDDTRSPAYKDINPASYTPLTSFQSKLHDIAKISNFLSCSYLPPAKYAQFPFGDVIKYMQDDFQELRDALSKINPKLLLIIETGVASAGQGTPYKNNVHNFKEYWRGMADFARNKKMMFHMIEAVDQPWKNIQDSPDTSKRTDINGPDGADAHYGWFKRVNNSVPLDYVEKILESHDEEQATPNNNSGGWSEDSPNLKLEILMASFFGFMLMLMLSIGYLWMKLRKAKRQVISPAYIEQFHTGGDGNNTKDDNYAVALRIPYDRKYELPKENFHIDKACVMGSGQCGVVLRGTIKGRSEPVAFKCTSSSSTVVDVKSLMSEIKILSYIGEHNNILCILGAYTKKIERGIVYVALEYCQLGSLESFLRKIDSRKLETANDSESVIEYKLMGDESCLMSVLNPGYVTTTALDSDSSSSSSRSSTPPQCSSSTPSSGYISTCELESSESKNSKLTQLVPKLPINSNNNVYQVDITTFYKWASQIASAMEFVSTKNVIHADLAARNVLLASVDQVKVCDFGLSRKLYQEMGVIHDKDTPLPWRWMASESLKHLIFSVESDVWAYGVTMWELFSLAEVPYHGITYDMKFAAQLEKGMRLPQAKYASSEVHNQLVKCWDIEPNNRPCFTTLKNFFKDLAR